MTRTNRHNRDKKKPSDKTMKTMEPAPSQAFMQRDTDTPLVNKFQVGMILEAEDPRNIQAFCIATITDILGPLIHLHLDGADGLNDFWKVIDSQDITPVGTAELNGQLLQPPLGYRKKVSTWHNFITKRKENAVKAGKECFPQKPDKPPKNLFEVGQKLEAADKKNSWYIFPATVGDVQDDQIFVTFDGWRGSMDYWCEYSSRDIFPMGWCKANGYNLQPAGERGDNPKVAENIKEALENRKRRTRSTKLLGSSGGVGASGWAQNKGLTSTVRDKPTQQRRSITKTSGSNCSSPIVANLVAPISNQRLRSLPLPSAATVETSTSSTAISSIVKPEVKNAVVLPSKSATPITATPVASTSPADCIKEADSDPASSTAVSADEVVNQESNNAVKSSSSTTLRDTVKEPAEDTKKEPVEEVETEPIVDTEKDLKSNMKSKKSSSVKSSPKKSPSKKTPVVKTAEDDEEKQLIVNAASNIPNDAVVTNTAVEENNEKVSEPDPSPIVVSENEADDIQTPDTEEMEVESQPENPDLAAAKGDTVAEVTESDVMSDSVSTTTSEKISSVKSDTAKPADDKAEAKTAKIVETSNNKSTTDTGGEVIEIPDDSMDEGDPPSIPFRTVKKRRPDEVTEGSDSSSSQKKSKKTRNVAAAAATPKSTQVQKQIKKAARYERKLLKQKRRVAKLQKLQESGDGDNTSATAGNGGDLPKVGPSQLSMVTASTPSRKRTISDGESIKSGHKKKKKKKKIPKTNEKQSSIQSSTPRLPPALFGDSGTPTTAYKQIQNPILRSPTSGWPSRLTMHSAFNMVTSDNKLGRFDMTTPMAVVPGCQNNGPAAKVDTITASPAKQMANSAAPADSMKTNSSKPEQQQEVVTSAEDASNTTALTTVVEQTKQSPTRSTSATVADKQVSKVDSTADNVVDNNDAVSSTTSPSPPGATEAPRAASQVVAAAASPSKSTAPQTTATTIGAESPQVVPNAAMNGKAEEVAARGSVKNIADTTTVGGSSPRLLIKPPPPSSETVKPAAVAADNGDATSVHCEKIRRSRNPKRWTISQVCDFLMERDRTFEPIIHSFPKHEIDGAALLLIDKHNVKYLNLKLGPMLKLVRIVGQLREGLEERKQRIESASRAAQN